MELITFIMTLMVNQCTAIQQITLITLLETAVFEKSDTTKYMFPVH